MGNPFDQNLAKSAGLYVRPLLLGACMLFSFSLGAKEEEQLKQQKQTDKRFYGLVNFSYLDLIIFNKWGVSAGWQEKEDRQLELEYLQASVGAPLAFEAIGEIVDRRISLIRRHYPGKSFNFAYGLVYFDFTAFIGSDLLESVDESAPSSDLVEARSLGTYLSVGNRWKIGSRGVIGVDWLAWSQPWFRLEERSGFLDEVVDEDDRDTVQDAMRVVYRFPRITLLKIQAGLRF